MKTKTNKRNPQTLVPEIAIASESLIPIVFASDGTMTESRLVRWGYGAAPKFPSSVTFGSRQSKRYWPASDIFYYVRENIATKCPEEAARIERALIELINNQCEARDKTRAKAIQKAKAEAVA